MPNDIAPDGADVFILPRDTHQISQLVKGQGAINQKLLLVQALKLLVLQAELIRQWAEHLGDDVLQGHNARTGPKFIDHQDQVPPSCTESASAIFLKTSFPERPAALV